jgi:hypothetical protein
LEFLFVIRNKTRFGICVQVVAGAAFLPELRWCGTKADDPGQAGITDAGYSCAY